MVPLQRCALLGLVRRDGFAHKELIAFIKERAYETALNIQKQSRRGEKLDSGTKSVVNPLCVLSYLRCEFRPIQKEVIGHCAPLETSTSESLLLRSSVICILNPV